MLGFLTVLIAVAVVILVLVGVAMLFDVTMGDGRRAVAEKVAESRRWRPPYVSGRELYTWARSIAADIVGDVVHAVPDSAAPAVLTSRLNQGAANAMLPGMEARDTLRTVPCPREGQGIIGVSAPEALRLAEYLRQRLSAPDLRRLSERSQRSAESLSPGSTADPTSDACALQGDGCLCVAYPDRPLACRPLHAAIIAHELDLDLIGSDDSSSPLEDHMEIVGLGMAEGLAEGLERVGLDANRYELHSALALAIDRPDAAERWAAGEDVFGGCRVLRPGPSARDRADPVVDTL